MATEPLDTENEGAVLGVLDELTGYHLRRASAAFAVNFSRALAGTGMRQVLFGILAVVSANARINQGAVGRVLGIQRANMVALINELVDEGLIERHVSKEDRRAFALSLTKAGEAKLAQCLKKIRAHEEEMLADLVDGDRATLITLLTRIEARAR